jgi:hypothetical protein
VQVEFYLPETVNLELARRDAFQDMGHKLRQWRFNFKEKLQIQVDDTPETIRARVGAGFLQKYDTLDVAHMLERWCSEKDKVGDDLYFYFVYFN